MKIEIFWGLYAAVAICSVGLALLLFRRRRARGAGPREVIADVAVECMNDILIPDGDGGQIYVEHLLLTSRGVVVIDVKEYQGTVFASDKMSEWTVIGKGRRFGFPNPQATLYDRVAAVRLLVRNVPVEGYILFRNDADFSKGRPKHVLLAKELESRYARPDANQRDRLTEAFAPHWAQIRAAAVPADTPA